MATNLPTTRQLSHFLSLVEHEHFGRAADSEFVSQSALSSSIKELEQRLGTQLVDRTNRQVTITATGQEVATQARMVIRDLNSLVEIAAGEKAPLTGELRLGVIPTIAPFLLPKVLPKLRRKFPDLQLYLTEDRTDRIHERLMDGALDVLLLALPWELRGVETYDLFNDPFRLACRKGTERVDPNQYRFNRLETDSILLLEDGHCLRDHALAACKIRNTQKVQRFSASSLLTLIEMVDADLGITFLPAMADGSALLRNTHVELHEMGELSYRKIGLAWRRRSGRAEEFQLLGQYVREFSGDRA
ncbi:MAG: LysR substrate-binding domain-containing protein [Pseudomonadota bacterium]